MELTLLRPLWLLALIPWLWQGWRWDELARESGLAGQKALIGRLREILRACGIPELGS